MRYPIPVRIRVFGKNAYDYTVKSVIERGQLAALDGIGFYAVGFDKIDPNEIRSIQSTAIEGTIVVNADTVFSAINKLYRGSSHPGIIGTGLENPGRCSKAIYRDEAICGWPICELPDCETEQNFSISPQGWAMCKYVADNFVSEENKYCHCFLQGAGEPPTGCLSEAYVQEVGYMGIDIEAKTDGSGILYYPFMPDVYDRIEKEG